MAVKNNGIVAHGINSFEARMEFDNGELYHIFYDTYEQAEATLKKEIAYLEWMDRFHTNHYMDGRPIQRNDDGEREYPPDNPVETPVSCSDEIPF